MAKIVNMSRFSIDNKLFLLLLCLTFVVFIFTTDAHRYTIDEDITQQQALRLVTLQPDPNYVQGQSKMEFNYPFLQPWLSGPPCQDAILCYPSYIGHAITELPLVLINHYLHIINQNTVVLTNSNFDDPQYVFWRNSIDPDFIFMEFLYGPIISSLSVGIFFLTCRAFNFENRTSVILSLLYGFATTIFAYSKTSLNVVPETLFILLALYQFRKFQNRHKPIDIIFCSSSLGFAFLVRPDAILIIVPFLIFLFYELRKHKEKLKKLFFFITPLVLSYSIYKIVEFLRYGSNSPGVSATVSTASSLITIPIPLSLFGIFLSPGVGLMIFAPILLTAFLSFPDFYKRNKPECILFISIIAIISISYTADDHSWHGLVAWGARYLLPIVSFLLLPLGASIEMRKSKVIVFFIILLGILGVFFNLVYMVQDVSWFVWGLPGHNQHMFAIAKPSDPLYISPAFLWSFEYSQLTQSIITAFTHLQPDIFLLRLLGPIGYGIPLILIVASLTYLIFHVLKNRKDTICSEDISRPD